MREEVTKPNSMSVYEDLEIRTLGELEKIVYEYIPQHLVGAEQRHFMQACSGSWIMTTPHADKSLFVYEYFGTFGNDSSCYQELFDQLPT